MKEKLDMDEIKFMIMAVISNKKGFIKEITEKYDSKSDRYGAVILMHHKLHAEVEILQSVLDTINGDSNSLRKHLS
jgi:hypothetical protein